MIGESGLTTALHDVGYVLTDTAPDYVVLGETRTYSFSAVTRAIRLILGGARFVATNPDPVGPSAEGVLPATGAVAAMISKATGVEPYYVGKPNPLMMRAALNQLGAHSESTVMVGDRMDTDVLAGVEAGMRTVLVLSGIVRAEEIDRFPVPPAPRGVVDRGSGGRDLRFGWRWSHADGHVGVGPGPIEGGTDRLAGSPPAMTTMAMTLLGLSLGRGQPSVTHDCHQTRIVTQRDRVRK